MPVSEVRFRRSTHLFGIGIKRLICGTSGLEPRPSIQSEWPQSTLPRKITGPQSRHNRLLAGVTTIQCISNRFCEQYMAFSAGIAWPKIVSPIRKVSLTGQSCGCRSGILSVDQEEITLTRTTVPPLGGSESTPAFTGTESVADILEQELDPTIREWLGLVEKEPDLIRIPLNFEERTGHLPKLLHDVIARLRLDKGSKAPVSVAASSHGELRRKQGYTAAMVVDESRILQVCIFSTLHRNESRVIFSKLLPDVVTIADEVDAQLKQQVLCFLPAEKPRRATTN